MTIWIATLLLASLPALSHAQTAAPARPQHAILLVIDGLSYLAPERVGDHGQTVEGGHPPFAQDAWPMPLVVAGPGVRPGGRFPYSEQIDVVPTLTYLMGVKPPDNAMGRIMAEALMNPPANVPPRQQHLKELNLVLLEHDRKVNQLREQVKTNPSLQPVLKDVEQNFLDVEKILHWYKVGTVDKLIAHNREVLRRIPASIK